MIHNACTKNNHVLCQHVYLPVRTDWKPFSIPHCPCECAAWENIEHSPGECESECLYFVTALWYSIVGPERWGSLKTEEPHEKHTR